jgi:hypothetical protein
VYVTSICDPACGTEPAAKMSVFSAEFERWVASGGSQAVVRELRALSVSVGWADRRAC